MNTVQEIKYALENEKCVGDIYIYIKSIITRYWRLRFYKYYGITESKLTIYKPEVHMIINRILPEN
jgi:hypothetical protein